MSESAYRSDLRAIARGYWSGVYTQNQFYDLMFNAIDRGVTQAWYEGAKLAGILPGEITPAEQLRIMDIVFREYSILPNLEAFIAEGSKENGGLLRDVFYRIDKWVKRYKDVVGRAKVASMGDQKLMWVLGPTKDHCTTCYKLHGKVKRASWWYDHVVPQNYPNPNLECGGWECKCELVPTDEPLSRGRMPNLP